MNSRTTRLFRQVKADPSSTVNRLGVDLRAAWHAAPSSRIRGRVNGRVRAIVAGQRVTHARKMKLAFEQGRRDGHQ
jgi:hypothetical protein